MLSGSWQGQLGWDGWGVPGSSSSSAVRDLVDGAVDRVRWWAEQCDRMQGERRQTPLTPSQQEHLCTGRDSLLQALDALLLHCVSMAMLCLVTDNGRRVCRG